MPIGKIDPFVFKLIEVLADPYAIFGADGKIIRQNDAFSRWVWPLRAQPESNGSFYDLFSPSKKNTLEAAIGTIIRFGSPIVFRTSEIEPTLKQFRAVFIPYAEESPSEPLILAVFRFDENFPSPCLTELVIARHKAESAEQAKSRFLANMSHEIHTPLNGILGTLQIIEETPLSPTQFEYVRDMKRSAEYLLDMLDRVLALSKLERGEGVLQEVDFSLSDLCQEIAETYRARINKKNLGWSTEFDEALRPRLRADATALKRIMGYLLDNAIKYTNAGSIQVSCRLLFNNPRIGEQIVLFTITDTGVGIPEEALSEVFTSFSRGDNVSGKENGGIGLGLTISKYLIEKLKGKIWLLSDEEMGTSVSFALPLRYAVSDDILSRDEKGGGDSSNRSDGEKTLLIAEDEPINRKLLQLILMQKNYTVFSAANGIEALAVWETNPVDCILMDLQMPDMDGLEATRRIREKEKNLTRRTLIIGLTGYGKKEDVDRCYAAGMDAYLQKPIDREVLLNLITGKNNQVRGVVP